MHVKLVSHTPFPAELAGQAAATCYNGSDPMRALQAALAGRHESVLEHVNFTFQVDGISRVTLAQLTRHRLCSFSVLSQRYTDSGSVGYVVPPMIAMNGEMMMRYKKHMTQAQKLYADMVEAGIPKEDARYLLPEATKTRLMMTCNARELRHILSLRCCARAQWEIRRMAMLMLREVMRVAPDLFRDAGPSCNREGCHEHHSCGKPWRKEDEA